MRAFYSMALLSGGLLVLGCSQSVTGTTDSDSGILVPEYANSAASIVDAAGVGGAGFPDNLALTTDQKAALEGLHQGFRNATAGDVEALHALESQARAAREAGKTRDEIHAILVQGEPILARMKAAFDQLQAAIWQVYTPDQRAWIESHRPRPCGPDGPPPLSDAQKQQIHSLQEAFGAAVRDDVAFIRDAGDQANAAKQSGASREAVEQILHRADAARGRVHAAELKLQQDLDAVLTPGQREARCQPQAGGPPPPPRN